MHATLNIPDDSSLKCKNFPVQGVRSEKEEQYIGKLVDGIPDSFNHFFIKLVCSSPYLSINRP